MKIPARIQPAWQAIKNRLFSVLPMAGVDASGRRFIAFAEKKWVRDYPARPDAVFLVGLVPWRAAIYNCAYVANHLARKDGAIVETYHFIGPRERPLERIYESFGAHLGLSLPTGRAAQARARALASEIFQGLRTKQDVLDIRVEGVFLGDLIYDSYLRYLCEPTIDIKDERLRETIREALLVYEATRDYLKRKKVVGFITDDYSYLNAGIPTRVLALAGVPIYRVVFGAEFFLFQLEYACARHNVPCVPYYRFKDTFKELPAAEQERARAKGRQMLNERLAGKIDSKTLQTITAYGDTATGRILEETGRPRIVVMLHDFIDAPHSYRWTLFPDFLEWISFLLEHALKTPFDWYVKPHPSSGEKSRREIVRINSEVIEVLKTRFPGIRFLDPSTSNRQIIADGISAMFTVHGTGAHEFAYMGVPVVNAGDNPHIQYDFNIHARTLEEYASYISAADRLEVEIDKSEIEELCYMYYLHGAETYCRGANPIDPAIFRTEQLVREMAGPRAFDLFMSKATAARERELNAYLDAFPQEGFSPVLRAEWADPNPKLGGGICSPAGEFESLAVR